MKDLEQKVIPNSYNPSSRGFTGILKEATKIFEWRFNLPAFFEAITGNKPYPYQANFLKKMQSLRNEYAIISAGRGCLEANSPIQMADGTIKKIKDIKEGEYVVSFNPDFKRLEPHKVIANLPQGKDFVYKIKGSKIKGNWLEVTSDHPIMDSHFRFKEAEKYLTDQWRTSKFDSLFVEEFDTNKEFLADDIVEFLGFLIAEGSYGNKQSPKLTSNNKEILERMRLIAIKNWGLNPKYYPKNKGYDLLLTRDSKIGISPLISFLRELNIYGQTKEKKRVPQLIFKSSNRQIRLFLQSFMKGDGNIDKRGKRIQISLYAGLSKLLAEDLLKLLSRLGIYGKIYIRNRSGNKNYSVRFFQKHKFERLFKASNQKYSYQHTRFSSVPIGKRKIFDLEVEGLHNFISNGFVVHNTGKTECLAILALWYIYVLPLTSPGVPMKVVILAGSERQAKICYDPETEVLTKNGWKKGMNISREEEILVFNKNKDRLEFQPILDKQVFNYSGPLYHWQSIHTDLKVTPEHRVLFRRFSRKENPPHSWSSLKTLKAQNCPKRLKFLCAKPFHSSKELPFSENLIRLLSWIITEGSYFKKHKGIKIAQSEKANPKKYQKLKNLLESMKLSFSNNDHGFYIRAKDGKWIRDILKEPHNLPLQWIFEASQEQLKIFYDTLLEGDGNVNGHYFSKRKKLAEAFQLICLFLGRKSILSKDRANLYRVSSVAREEEEVRNRTLDMYSGKVWDVTVPSSYLVIRRKNKILISGNCYGYIMGYIAKIPFLQKALAKDPTAEEILFVDGSWIRPLTASEKCFDDKTKIFTENGFKFFSDLKLTDRVATLDKNGNFQFQIPTKIIKEKYTGPMFEFKNKVFSMKVSPNHNLYVKRNHAKNFSFLKPYQIPIGALFKTTADFKGKETPTFSLPEYIADHGVYKEVFKEKVIPMDLWLEFLGYYVSEGSLHGSRKVRISQSKGSHPREWSKINRLLRKLDISYSYYSGKTSKYFEIYSSQLAHYLKSFGKARTKFIPREFLEVSKRQLKILLDALIVGDGWIDRNGIHYFTSSSRLRDSIIEITQKLGIQTSFFIVEESLTRKGNKRGSGWKINIQKEKTRKYNGKGNWVPYSGKIYCVQVPNHVILVERDGKIHWSGNSVRGPHPDLLIIDEACQAKDDLLKAAMPMLGTSKYPRLVLSSTPDKFFSLFVEVYNNPKDFPQFLRFNWSTEDCPLVSKSFLTSQKGLIDRGNYVIEYLGLPYSFTGKVFPLAKLKLCVKARNLVKGKGNIYAGVDWGHCLTGDSEVLTRKGWIRLDNYNGEESILTYRKDGILEFQKPINFFKRRSKRIISGWEARHYSVLGTWKHLIPTFDRNKNRFHLHRLSENLTHHYLIRTGKWKGIRKTKILGFEAKAFLKLLGWFLSEGSVEKATNRVIIGQIKSKYREEIFNLLKAMGLKPYLHKFGIRFSSKTLASYFRKLGKSRTKFIPLEIKALSSDLLQVLLLTLMKGDGDKDGYRYNTFSKRLADDILEVALKTGRISYISRRFRKLRNAIEYRVHFLKYPTTPQKGHYFEKLFSGYFVGIEVPNEFVLIRRKGRPTIVHNFPSPTILVIVEQEIDQRGEGKWKVLYTEAYLKQNFEEVLKKIELIVRSYSVSNIYTDSNDIGENQRLSARGLPVFPVKFKSQKAAMISNLRALVENEKIKIDGAKDYPLVAQMRDYRYDSKKNDDYVDALMLAVKGGRQMLPLKWNLKDFIVVTKRKKKLPSTSNIRHQMDIRYMKPKELITKKEKDMWMKLREKRREEGK